MLMKTIKATSKKMTNVQLAQAADCLRVLAHPQRLDLVQCLLMHRYTVGELAVACDLSPAMTSGHLRLMQRCGLLTLHRDSRHVYYSIAEPCLHELMECIAHQFTQK
jgi:ArsR family transcriptional regulator, zinc-responsive transcriptional repressor